MSAARRWRCGLRDGACRSGGLRRRECDEAAGQRKLGTLRKSGCREACGITRVEQRNVIRGVGAFCRPADDGGQEPPYHCKPVTAHRELVAARACGRGLIRCGGAGIDPAAAIAGEIDAGRPAAQQHDTGERRAAHDALRAHARCRIVIAVRCGITTPLGSDRHPHPRPNEQRPCRCCREPRLARPIAVQKRVTPSPDGRSHGACRRPADLFEASLR